MSRLLLLATATAVTSLPAAAPEPWGPLAGGGFTGPPVPLSPDPLVRYVWGGGVNAHDLQLFNTTAVSSYLEPPTLGSAFAGYETLTSASPSVRVSGAGSIGLDFGVELPAWLELDSADLSAADLPKLQLGLGEFDGVYKLRTAKQLTPIKYASTYRLETNTALYEGVRFAFIVMTAAPSTPFTITGFRAVAQAKPVNYTGSFNAPGDAVSTSSYYTAAYTVRTNLEPDYMGAVLVDRGDRISWAGDAHVSQAASLAVFGNVGDVATNLNVTSASQNGIASYSLYFTDSVMDLHDYTHDPALLAQYKTHVSALLTTAWSHFNKSSSLTFFGWDDRLGSGFANASCDESQWAYRFIAVKEFNRWGDVLAASGDAAGAAVFHGYATAGAAWAKAALTALAPAGAAWWSPLGIHATGEVVNAGLLDAAEKAAVLSGRFNDSTTICSYSPFNTAWLLDALAGLGGVERGVAAIQLCWGTQLAMGATTFWEIAAPTWVDFIAPGGLIPNGENGFTSLCHPWSAAPTSWLAKHVLGVRLMPVGSTIGRVLVAPHVTPAMAVEEAGVTGALILEGDVPVGGGSAVHVEVRRGSVSVTLPPGVDGTLVLTELLLVRLGMQLDASVNLSINGADDEFSLSQRWIAAEEAPYSLPLSHYAPPLMEGEGGASTNALSRFALLELTPGATAVISFDVTSAPTPSTPVSLYPPFPPAAWRATFLSSDRATRGTWMGTYGADGGIAFGAGAGGNSDVAFLPPYITSVKPAFNFLRGQWADGVRVADVRALQDHTNATGPRTASYMAHPGSSGNPTFVVDVTVAPGAKSFTLSAYVLDWDSRGRIGTLSVMDGRTLDPVAPVVGFQDAVDGVWFSWTYNASFRIRFSQVSGCVIVAAFVFTYIANRNDVTHYFPRSLTHTFMPLSRRREATTPWSARSCLGRQRRDARPLRMSGRCER